MAFKVRDLMVNVLAAGKGKPKPGPPTRCGGPTCKPPPCPDPSNPGVYEGESSARDLELLRRELRATLEQAPAAQ